MKRQRLHFVFGLVLLFSSCVDTSEQRQVRGDFLKDHPDYTVVSVGDADGNDSTVVTFFIRYKRPNDEREYWADWAYDTKDGKFALVRKGSENLLSDKVVR